MVQSYVVKGIADEKTKLGVVGFVNGIGLELGLCRGGLGLVQGGIWLLKRRRRDNRWWVAILEKAL